MIMAHTLSLFRLGDLGVTVPAAIAIAAWLLTRRAWRLAWRWSWLFALGMLTVGVSKIAYLGWGVGVPALEFKAVSGHAAGATAVWPFLLYLSMRQWRDVRRQPWPPPGQPCPGVASGLMLGLLVTALLVLAREHSLAEALTGYGLGALVSLFTLRSAAALPPPAPLWLLLLVALAALTALWLMRFAHVGYWMIKAARLLSGNSNLHPLTLD